MSHQEKQEIFDRNSIEKWKLNFKDFLSGTINEVHGEVLSTQDAIVQIEEVVFAACDLVQAEQQKRIAQKLPRDGKSNLHCAGVKDLITNPENKIQ